MSKRSGPSAGELNPGQVKFVKKEGHGFSYSSDSYDDNKHQGNFSSGPDGSGAAVSYSPSMMGQKFQRSTGQPSSHARTAYPIPSYAPQVGISFDNRSSFSLDYSSREDDSGEGSDESEEEAPDSTRTTTSSLFTGAAGSKAEMMMRKMGYQAGKGLGKHEQGMAAPIEASQQRGRRGLGLRLEGLEASEDVEWTEEEEEIVVEQEPDWIPDCQEFPPQANEMSLWRKIDKRKLEILDETTFCNEKLLRGVLESKSVFNALGQDEFLKARTRSNPYELVKGAIFQNRAAVKMANMDRSTGFMFTQPKDENSRSLVGHNEVLYFADVCSGPGGFSEYVLWRKKWHAKGFGFTIKGEHDFRLGDFLAGSSETFEPFYGVDGVNGDGDIMREDNLVELRRYVMENTDNKGVHFVMADGGFSVEGQENLQEILTKQLVLCQFLAALSLLREGGHFVCKTFDLFTPFNVGLIYLLYRAFRRIAIFKPVTSRPANSERFVICQNLRSGSEAIHDYLFDVNVTINRLRSSGYKDDVLEVVPLQMILDDTAFTEYITKSNESFAVNQIRALKKLKAYVQNMNLVGPNQGDIRKQCLDYWEVPDEARSAPKKVEADDRFEQLWKDGAIECFSCERTPLMLTNMKNIRWLHNYKCFVSGGERYFLLGLGRIQTFKWDGRPHLGRAKWDKITIKVELPRDTLLEVELVHEFKGEGKGQRKLTAIHVIDAAFLGGVNITGKSYQDRLADITKFTKAISKPSRNDIVHIRVKQVMRLEDISNIYKRLEMKQMKGRTESLCYLCEDGRYFVPAGVVVLKLFRDPWLKCLSSKDYWYFNNTTTKKSLMECPADALASFQVCLMNRYLWSFEDLMMPDLNSRRMDTAITKTDFEEFIAKSRVLASPKRH